MHMQEFSRTAPATPNGLAENETVESIEKIKIVVADLEKFDENSKLGVKSDVHLLEDNSSNVGQILARRESLDELIEDLEINSDIVKKD